MVGGGGIPQGYEPTQVPTLHPVLGFSWAEVDAYAERLTGADVPSGSPYSYGSRFRGTGGNARVVEEILRAGIAPSLNIAANNLPPAVDQIATQEALLVTDSRTRAAYLTPWRPEDDAGKESGTPCLTGVWFRAVPSAGAGQVVEWDIQTEYQVDPLGRMTDMGTTVTSKPIAAQGLHTLHMTVTFRGHDLFTGYAFNLAACCTWLVRLADKLGMGVGTLTCLSMSAYVCSRDIADAQKVVAAYKPPPGPRWDQRSSWRVELVSTPGAPVVEEDPLALFQSWREVGGYGSPWTQAADLIEQKLAAQHPGLICHDGELLGNEVATTGLRVREDGIASACYLHPKGRYPRSVVSACTMRHSAYNGWTEATWATPTVAEWETFDAFVLEIAPSVPPVPGPSLFSLRATALTPDGTEVLRVFEAKTPERLLRDIGESGLIQEVSGALWLGREVERVWVGRAGS